MTPTILPPWEITQGVGFYQEYRYLDDEAEELPLNNFAQYTATYRIAPNLAGPSVLTGQCVTNSGGYVIVSIDQSQTTTLSTSLRVGGQIAAEAQITITDQTGAVAMVWQMSVRISRSLTT